MEKTLRLDLPLLLPDTPDAHGACAQRLAESLETREGVSIAHVRNTESGGGMELCIHYDPALLSLERVREVAKAFGAEITSQFGHLVWQVEGIPDQRRARAVSAQLRSLPGVVEAEANAKGPLRIEFDRRQTDENTLRNALQNMRLSLVQDESRPHEPTGEAHDHEHGGIFGAQTELIFVALCGALLLIGWLLPKFVAMPSWAPLFVLVPAYFFGGYYALREAIDSVRNGRFEIDFLMLVAAAGAAALGEWAEGALLLFLFSLGHALEGYAMGRAKRAIEALGALAPKTATVRRDGKVEEIAVDALRVGDIVLVKPNERLAADGFVIKGESSVNQAPITGESVPVDKSPVGDANVAAEKPDLVDAGNRVFAGTINGGGALEIQVTRTSADSTLARVVKMVNEAETNQSPEAARRTVRRLDARKIDTCQVPVIFEAPVASSLISHFVGAISGGALYRKASFLLDQVGQRVFPDFVQIYEQPLLKCAMGSAAYDSEGVTTSADNVVTNGVLQRYLLGSYSARRLGLETTGNAGGIHNLTAESGDQDLANLIGGLEKGLLVTELIGFGVNMVTGDYSRGAAGFWI